MCIPVLSLQVKPSTFTYLVFVDRLAYNVFFLQSTGTQTVSKKFDASFHSLCPQCSSFHASPWTPGTRGEYYTHMYVDVDGWMDGRIYRRTDRFVYNIGSIYDSIVTETTSFFLLWQKWSNFLGCLASQTLHLVCSCSTLEPLWLVHILICYRTHWDIDKLDLGNKGI